MYAIFKSNWKILTPNLVPLRLCKILWRHLMWYLIGFLALKTDHLFWMRDSHVYEIDGLMLKRCKSSANVLKLCLFNIKLLQWAEMSPWVSSACSLLCSVDARCVGAHQRLHHPYRTCGVCWFDDRWRLGFATVERFKIWKKIRNDDLTNLCCAEFILKKPGVKSTMM